MVIICIGLTGVGLWILGQKKNSRMTAFTGGLAAAAPLLYIAGGALLLPFAPLLALGAAYWTVASTNNESNFSS
jgi:hypothetical protein